jgi:DNA repair protein RadC
MEGIKCMLVEERPREKLAQLGRRALTDVELLAIILGTGSADKSALQLARQILLEFNGLNGLRRAEVEELCKIKGIGSAKAINILAAFELGQRSEKDIYQTIIKSSKDVYEQFIWIGDLNHEEFHVVFLNRANKIISKKCISQGGMSGTVADGKIIFKMALDLRSQAIVLIHNHPSGQLKPSEADIKLTRRLKEFGSLIDISILDHLIISNKGYYSFSDELQL